MSYFRKSLTREEFMKRAFDKSKSDGTVRQVKSAYSIFDKFCLAKYKKNSSEVVEDLKQIKDDRLYIFLDNFASFMNENKLSHVQAA